MSANLRWGIPTPDHRTPPWKKLSDERLTMRQLLWDSEETQLLVITEDSRPAELNIVGRIVYLSQPEFVKEEARYNRIAYDNVVRGAGHILTRTQRRSDQLADDEELLQSICELLQLDWLAVKHDPLLRLLIGGALAPVSLSYAWAKRERLQTTSIRTGSSVNLKDSWGRDNPLITVTKLFWSRPLLREQKRINDRAVRAAERRLATSQALQIYVELLISDLLMAASSDSAQETYRRFQNLEEFVIFNSLGHGVRAARESLKGKRVNAESMAVVVSIVAAERLLCSLSELVSLVRSEVDFRKPAVFDQMRELLDWDQFSPSYSAMAVQLRGEIDELQSLCANRPRLVLAQTRNIKSIIRDRRPNRTKQLLKAHEEFQMAS